ncbi:MAG TPA: hemolysin III family protein [Longimicrobiales bacterium]
MQYGEDLSRIAEDIANSVTHGVGLGLSLAGFAVLLVLASDHGSARLLISCGVYGASLVGLYAASTLYHSFREPRLKHLLRIVDHCAIYLLIAGTYTPFLMVNLDHTPAAPVLLGTVWLLALAGIAFKIHSIGRYPRLSTLLYLVMSWVLLVSMKPILSAIPATGLIWLLAGGVLYTGGVWFYVRDERVRFNHAIWHLFVLGGSACHYIAVYVSVLPR